MTGVGTVRRVRDPNEVSPGLWIIGICSAVTILVIMVAAIRTGIAALGNPSDRGAANETLWRVAGLLGGRYRDRREIPWYRRPAQYGAVDGSLSGFDYDLMIMPWNAEDCGGSAMLRLRTRRDGLDRRTRWDRVIFSPEHVFHWPDRGTPEGLADFVRRTVADIDPRE